MILRFPTITRITTGTLIAICLSIGAWDQPPEEAGQVLAQACPPLAVDVADPVVQEFATAQGICMTPAGQTTSDLESGVFVKNPTYIGRDAHATVGGRCLFRTFSGGACVTGFETLRSIGYVAISTKPPVWVATNNYIYPTNPSETQNMDSRVSGTTTGTHTVLLSQIGRWKFDYWSNNNPTNCSIQPTQSPVKTMSVNVLDCAPAWWTIPPTNKTLHAPLGTIYVHIPPSMWSDLQAAVSAAVADWNAALAGTGVSLQVVDYDCGEGGNCVNFFEGGEFGPDDGCAAAHPGSSGPDGAFTSPPGISLPNLPATKNWRLRPFDRLRRSVAHELDHILGSNHTGSPCTNATSIMTPLSVVSLTDCNTATADPMNPSPTPNDTLPVGSSTYGNQLQKWCNF